MDTVAFDENADRQTKADAKVVLQRSALHAALERDRFGQQRLLDAMRHNSATLQVNRALLEYGENAELQQTSDSPDWVNTSAVVQKLEKFGPLTDNDRMYIGKFIASAQEVAGKADLIREGDKPSHVHVVTSGLACRYKQLSDGKYQIVAFLLPGDFCDVHASMLSTMDHSIATLAPSKIAMVSKEAIFGFLGRPTLAKALLTALLVDAAVLREWIANLGQRTAEHRIAHLFCELLARLKSVGAAVGDTFSLPISQAELSCAVGLSLVHTNRSLKLLRDRGLINYHRGQIKIINLLELETLCGFKPNYLHLE